MPFKIELFGIPLKKASDVDILKPLKNLITSRYQTSEQESYISAINEFSKLRTNSVCRNLDYHENSLDLLYRYYDQIVALEQKVPAAEVQIPFKWKDAFDRGSIFGGRISLTISLLSYEKVCVLYNIGALQSQIAALVSTDSDTSLKTATRFFQNASGIFNHLKGIVNASLQTEPTPDLQADTLSALSSLCISQAQEIVMAKAISDKMKDASIAKLCAQCEEYYSETLKLMQKEVLRNLWDRDWIPKITGKQIGYQALADYHQSKVCHATKEVGEEIARLKKAVELFKSAQSKSGIYTMFSDEINRAQQALDMAVKDNDFIYHARIPDTQSLQAVSKFAVAKPTPVPAKFSTDLTDLFETLVPVVVQQALVQYDTRKEEIVNGEIGKLRDNTQLLNSILASLNLPAAIEDKGGDNLPQSIKEKSTTLCDLGGIQMLEQKIRELPELLLRNKEILDECDKLLREEKESDDQLRAQFKEKWMRTPSEKLTQTFQNNAQKYRSVIDTAIQADSTIKSKFESHHHGIELLSQGPDELSKALPSAGSDVGKGMAPAAGRLRQLMEEVETLKVERDVIESEFKSSTIDMRDVFLSALTQDGAINEPALSVESLGRVFGPLQKQVKESIEKQNELVANIQNAHSEFSDTSGSGGDREALLKKLAAANDAFLELNHNLDEGTKFYNDLTQLLVTFQSKINDFCFARKTEKDELMRDLTSGLARQPVSGPPASPAHHQEAGKRSPPPPRPPPPSANPYQGAPQSATAPLTDGCVPYSYQPPPSGALPGYGGAPMAAPSLPYPVMPQGMPTPQGYQYPSYTPMPQGYNPYFQQQQRPPTYQVGYPQQYPTHPYPQEPYQQQPFPPSYPPQQWPRQ